jgi:general secretion pathway protein D
MKLNKLILIFLLVFSTLLHGAKDEIELNIKEMEIADFVKMVADITRQNILVPLSVRGKIDFISQKPIKKRNLSDLLIDILKSKGFTLADSGNGYYIVIRISDASREAPPVQETSQTLMHTAILAVKNSDANKMSSQFKHLLSRSGKIVVSKEVNSIVVTDFPLNIKVIRNLIRKLDRKIEKITIFKKLKYAKADEILPQVKNMANAMFDKNSFGEEIDVIKDDFSDSLILVGNKTAVYKLMPFIDKIDKAENGYKQNLYFIKLNNANADELAKTLNAIIGKKKYSKNEQKPTISTDNELNSLILLSSPEDHEEIIKLIDKLDVERQQVYVKVKIVEISETRAKDLGAKYGLSSGMTTSTGLYTLGTTLNGGSALAVSPSDFGLSIPSFSKGFALGIGLSFLNQNGVSNTLSEPSILCINNQESSIYVGKTQSILSQSTTGTSTLDATRNSYTREDIGLTLKIKPRLSNDSKVVLTVDTTLEDIEATSAVGLPTTTKREVKTVAIVQSGESVIIGGLIRNKRDVQESKVPIIGDIPLLGALFRWESDTVDKTNLVIVMTPYIINTSSELSKIREALEELDILERKVVENVMNKQRRDMLNNSQLKLQNKEKNSDD